jgi:hypothetical protein
MFGGLKTLFTFAAAFTARVHRKTENAGRAWKGIVYCLIVFWTNMIRFEIKNPKK